MKGDELVRTMRSDEKWVRRISWQNAPTSGSAEFLKVSGRIGEAATRIERIAKDNVSQQCKILMLTAEVEELRQVASENSELKEAQRWVPVSKLPKRANYYSTSWVDSDGIVWVGEAFYDTKTKQFRTSFDQSTDHEITHWQPLPAAPKGGFD